MEVQVIDTLITIGTVWGVGTLLLLALDLVLGHDLIDNGQVTPAAGIALLWPLVCLALICIAAICLVVLAILIPVNLFRFRNE